MEINITKYHNIIVSVALFVAVSVFSADPSIDFSLNNHIKIQLTYGNINMLPSIAAYSNMPIDYASNYSDVLISTKNKINQFTSYYGQLELTDQPHFLIGTIHSRPDYLISTGRFQRSELRYENKSIRVQVGRCDFFCDDKRSDIYTKPINGDGLSWVYNQPRWSFKHVIASLPSQVSKGIVFRRVLSYHHLSGKCGNLTYGAGEYFILTGNTVGLDFKRLNPFVPYSRNSHDSYFDMYPGYEYDSDNTIIKLFLKWGGTSSFLDINFYIDEFQVDKNDRVTYNDALLLNIFGRSRFKLSESAKLAFIVEGNISVSNPNFSDHPGPTTSAISGIFPLLESGLGTIGLIYLKTQIEFDEYKSMILSYYNEHWIDIATLPAELRNQRQSLELLPIIRDSRFSYSYMQEIKSTNLSFMLQGWRSFHNDEKNGARLYLMYKYEF